jgi:low affinity Fe/Cu permease
MRETLPTRAGSAHLASMDADRRADGWFRGLSERVSCWAGTHGAFMLALAVVTAWIATGPLFGFSDTWQLVINTGTTIVTFLMVFLIQATQNRDSKAIQLKLDELIRAHQHARNVFASLEDASDEELERFAKEFRALRHRGLPKQHAVRKAAAAATDE